jgi:hypothetical protein
MDHHDWDQWSEDDAGLGDHDTADLGGGEHPGPEHLGGLSEHDPLAGYDEHDGYPDSHGHTPPPDLSHGPDLLHESGDYDVPQHDHPDLGPDPHDPAGPGHYDQPDPAAEHDGGVEHLVGVDPDLPGDHDPGGPDGWHDGDFPPALDLDARPEPSDGYPWADPDTLGDPDSAPLDGDHAGYGLGATAPASDLFAYAGLDAAPPGVDPWSLLFGSDDPATSALARWWGPTG